jgi:rare lipoprotein A (peptidoglycan hydrolase)
MISLIILLCSLTTNETQKGTATYYGPKSSRHLIDLSYGAAKQLNFIRSGITTVSIQVVGTLPIKK